MKTNNFILTNCDTDSISFCKADMSEFTKDEIDSLNAEINSYFPENIRWEDDGNFRIFIVLKAKNYIMYDGKKIKIKGSGLKDSKKEPALNNMLNEIVNDLVFNSGDNIHKIYTKYILEAQNPTDIAKWSQKKTVTKSVLEADKPDGRKNEKDVLDAIRNKHIQEGDKIHVYPCVLDRKIERTEFKNGKSKEKVALITGLKCVEDYANDHNVEHLIKRVYNTLSIFSSIIDMSKYIDYTKSKNKHLLAEINTSELYRD